MYWTTTKTVECSRLNSEERFDYERISGISDDLIAGLTLDLSGGFVYWMSLVIDDSIQLLKLYRAKLAGMRLVKKDHKCFTFMFEYVQFVQHAVIEIS